MKPTTAPLELRGPIDHTDPGVRASIDAAMQAALNGDFSALNRIELDYLNLIARIGELVVRHADGRLHRWFDRPQDDRYVLEGVYQTHAPFAVRILRGFDPSGRSAIEWALLEKCRGCAGKLRRLPCRACGGRWYVGDANDHAAAVIYTDLDGVLLQEAG